MLDLLKKNTITRESLAKAIKRETGLSIQSASEIVDKIIEKIRGSLREGKEVKIRLFGHFYSKKKNKRIGRNPKTMKEAVIPERNVVKFKVAPTLKKRINNTIKQTA
jgi:integration host factor subunit alpha